MSTASMGLFSANTETKESALKTIGLAKKALAYVSNCRATYGALQNRLEHTYKNNKNKEENLTAAESRIRDTDMAKTMVEFSNGNVLAQAGLAMISQANQSRQNVLGLLG